jgi:hypothetical protein
VRVVVSEGARALIEERGGRLYVSLKRSRCCGAPTRLVTSNEPPERIDVRRFPACEEFALFLPARLDRLPEELHIDLRRFPTRVEAYWNGCAWVT